jgi:hypothetical protein
MNGEDDNPNLVKIKRKSIGMSGHLFMKNSYSDLPIRIICDTTLRGKTGFTMVKLTMFQCFKWERSCFGRPDRLKTYLRKNIVGHDCFSHIELPLYSSC